MQCVKAPSLVSQVWQGLHTSYRICIKQSVPIHYTGARCYDPVPVPVRLGWRVHLLGRFGSWSTAALWSVTVLPPLPQAEVK